MAQGGDNWWRDGIFYQIYPRSFQDSDGDGVGDLAGILRRLPYVKSLGVDAIWLSPIFPSPMADFGYDISDYTGIDPLFGTMADFDALLAAAHDNRAEADPRPRAEPHLKPASLVRREPVLARQSQARLVRLARSGRRWRCRRTTGCPNSAAARGSSTRRQVNITTTPSLPSSRTSTGAIRMSARRSTTRCGSGWRRASTASASM